VLSSVAACLHGLLLHLEDGSCEAVRFLQIAVNLCQKTTRPHTRGVRGNVVVKAPCHKPEGRRFDTR
jgi:hypothetical protein